MDPDFSTFRRACGQFGLDLAADQYRRLLDYARLVRDWNTRINLIARGDADRVLTYHVTDSLAVAPFVPPGARVCDLGSGAGLPGMPLAIARPDTRVFLVDSQQKRCRFLATAVRELALANAEVRPGRAEEQAGLDCDVVTSRLTGRLPDTLRYAAPHRRPGGTIVLYKTRAAPAELARSARLIARLGLAVSGQHDVDLPFTRIKRRFVVVGPA